MGEYRYKWKSWVALSRGKDFLSLAEELKRINPCPVILTVVNASFASEIMLKSIIYFEQGSVEKIGVHQLEGLFRLLEEEDQKIIKAEAGIDDWERFWLDTTNAFCTWHGCEKKEFLYIDPLDVLNFAKAIKNRTETIFKDLDLFSDEGSEIVCKMPAM